MAKIIKLSDLSEEERKKKLEQTKKEDAERKELIESQVSFKSKKNSESNSEDKESNSNTLPKASDFKINSNVSKSSKSNKRSWATPTTSSKKSIEDLANSTTKHQEEKEEKNKFVNKSGLSKIGSNLGYVAKSTGAGVASGTAGIAQGILTDVANQLDKGSQEDVKDTSAVLGKSLLNLITPGSNINSVTDSVSNLMKKTLPIVANNKKSLLEKGTELVMNATSEAKNSNVLGKLLNSSIQTIRKY